MQVPLVTNGIAAMLQGSDNAITGSAKSAAEALSLFEKNEYDIVLLDISLPDMNGITLCREIRKYNRQVKIIGLSSASEISIIAQLLQQGANGYLLKNIERSELLDAIFTVLKNKVYLSRDANEKLLQQYQYNVETVQTTPLLTRRETEILQLLSEGLTGPQIAKHLFLSPFTVETHRKNLMQKFDVSNVQLLLKLARQYNLIS
jgi:DNA-binding NarL/FixJ family response regulator